MASNTIKKCHICGAKIINAPYEYQGKPCCYACYAVKQQEIVQYEQSRNELVVYIQYLFPGQEIPFNVLQYIDREVSTNAKTLAGIKKVLYYYYEILDNRTDNLSSLLFIIRDYYDETKRYYIKQKQLREQNDAVDLNVSSKTVQIDVTSLKQVKNAPKYDITDL